MGRTVVVGQEGVACHCQCIEIAHVALVRRRTVGNDVVEMRVDVERSIAPCQRIGARHGERAVHQCPRPSIVELCAIVACHLSRKFVCSIEDVLGKWHVNLHLVALLPFAVDCKV